jgi:dephospho-CoA kinase
MLIIGITGGIASGKTEVAKIFQKMGALVLSGDEIGKVVVEKNPVLLRKLVNTFGKEILTKEKKLNRQKLGKIAFATSQSTRKLNDLVHPYLLQNLKSKIKNLKRKNYKNPVIIDAALIVEWGMQNELDFLIFVDCPRKKRIERLIRKKGYTRKEALDRIKAQLAERYKKREADFVIKNDRGLSELKQKAKSLWHKILQIKKKVDKKV